MRQTTPSRRLGRALFAPRQVYVRNGPVSQYVTLSRSLQASAAAGMGALLLWLGVATYVALDKHLETLAQARELARLESITKALQTSFEQEREPDHAEPDAAGVADSDLISEVAELKASRERAMMLADAAAGEADELRREVALAYERIRELELDLVKTELDEVPPTDATGGNPDTSRLIGRLLEPVACPSADTGPTATC